MEILPLDIYRVVALNYPAEKVAGYMSVVGLYPDKIFWQDKIIYDWNLSPSQIREIDNGEPPEELYIKVAACHNYPLLGVDRYLEGKKEICRMVWEATKSGREDIASLLITQITKYKEDIFTNNMTLMLASIGRLLFRNKDKQCDYDFIISAMSNRDIEGEFLTFISGLLTNRPIVAPPEKLSAEHLFGAIALTVICDNMTYLMSLGKLITDMVKENLGLFILRWTISNYGNKDSLQAMCNIVPNYKQELTNNLSILEVIKQGNRELVSTLLDSKRLEEINLSYRELAIESAVINNKPHMEKFLRRYFANL